MNLSSSPLLPLQPMGRHIGQFMAHRLRHILRGLVLGAVSWNLGLASAAESDDTTEPSPPPSTLSSQNSLDEKARQIVERMRAAHQKLADKNTGPETQTLQQQVVAALDELLKSPPQQNPNQSPPRGGGASSGAGQSGQRAESSSKPQDQSDSQATGRDPSSRPEGPTARNRERAEDAQERAGISRPVDVNALRRRRLEVDVWGHLPEKIREQLLSTYGEKMVPQYEDLVRKFYEVLSDPVPTTRSSPPYRP